MPGKPHHNNMTQDQKSNEEEATANPASNSNLTSAEVSPNIQNGNSQIDELIQQGILSLYSGPLYRQDRSGAFLPVGGEFLVRQYSNTDRYVPLRTGSSTRQVAHEAAQCQGTVIEDRGLRLEASTGRQLRSRLINTSSPPLAQAPPISSNAKRKPKSTKKPSLAQDEKNHGDYYNAAGQRRHKNASGADVRGQAQHTKWVLPRGNMILWALGAFGGNPTPATMDELATRAATATLAVESPPKDILDYAKNIVRHEVKASLDKFLKCKDEDLVHEVKAERGMEVKKPAGWQAKGRLIRFGIYPQDIPASVGNFADPMYAPSASDSTDVNQMSANGRSKRKRIEDQTTSSGKREADKEVSYDGDGDNQPEAKVAKRQSNERKPTAFPHGSSDPGQSYGYGPFMRATQLSSHGDAVNTSSGYLDQTMQPSEYPDPHRFQSRLDMNDTTYGMGLEQQAHKPYYGYLQELTPNQGFAHSSLLPGDNNDTSESEAAHGRIPSIQQLETRGYASSYQHFDEHDLDQLNPSPSFEVETESLPAQRQWSLDPELQNLIDLDGDTLND